MNDFFQGMPRRAPARRRGSSMLALGAISVLSGILTGCDASTEHAIVENDCGETLTIAIVETNTPYRDATARGVVADYGELVAPGSSVESSLMEGAGGFEVEALASDGSLYTQWYSFEEPERSFTLSHDAGTCPR